MFSAELGNPSAFLIPHNSQWLECDIDKREEVKWVNLTENSHLTDPGDDGMMDIKDMNCADEAKR